MAMPPRLTRVKYRRTRNSVTALRGSTPPADGTISLLVIPDPDGFDEHIWKFRFRAAFNIWEFAGGAEVQDQVDIEEQISSVSFADLASIGPLFTLPGSGYYLVGVSYSSGYRADPTVPLILVRIGDLDVYATGNSLGKQNAEVSTITGVIRWLAARDGQQARLLYAGATANPAWFARRTMWAIPQYIHQTPGGA